MIYIIVSVKNDNIGLLKTLRSLTIEDPNLFKCIVVDKSDFEIPDLSKLSFDITYHRQKDNGIYQAFNAGIKEVSDDNSWIIFLNSGDYLESGSLKTIVNFISKSNAKMFFLPTYSAGGYKSDLNLNNLMFGCDKVFPGHSSSFITTKKVYQQLNYYNTEYKFMSDYDFFLKAIDNGLVYEIIHNCFGVFTFGGFSSKNSYLEKRLEEIEIYKKNFIKYKFQKVFFLLIYSRFQIIYSFINILKLKK